MTAQTIGAVVPWISSFCIGSQLEFALQAAP